MYHEVSLNEVLCRTTTVSSSELQLVTRAAATRSAIPALGGVMLQAAGDGIALSATDTEIALQSSIPADIEQEGSLLLPARLLLDIVRVADGDASRSSPRPTRAW